MPELSLDFVAHLGERLGLDRDAAFATLVTWMAAYEPSGRLTMRPLSSSRQTTARGQR